MVKSIAGALNEVKVKDGGRTMKRSLNDEGWRWMMQLSYLIKIQVNDEGWMIRNPRPWKTKMKDEGRRMNDEKSFSFDHSSFLTRNNAHPCSDDSLNHSYLTITTSSKGISIEQCIHHFIEHTQSALTSSKCWLIVMKNISGVNLWGNVMSWKQNWIGVSGWKKKRNV